jgi:sugar lactone lactonase YvrE
MIRKILGTLALLALIAQVESSCRADLFVSTNDGILRFDRDGNSSVFASIGGTTGLTFDANGDLFAATDQRILKYSSQTGQLLDSFRPSTGFTSPSDMIFGPDGNLYVAVGRELRRMSSTGADQVILFSNPANNSVEGLAFDDAGHLFASLGNDLLVKFSTAGDLLDSASIPGFVFSNSDLAFGPSGSLFTTSSGRIDEFSTNLDNLGRFAQLGGTLKGLAFDDDGSLYVANGGSTGRISRLSADGQTVETFATGLNNPTYMAFGPSAVPEPGSLMLAGLGFSGLAGYSLIRRRAAGGGR